MDEYDDRQFTERGLKTRAILLEEFCRAATFGKYVSPYHRQAIREDLCETIEQRMLADRHEGVFWTRGRQSAVRSGSDEQGQVPQTRDRSL